MEIKIQVEKDKITSISQTPLAAGNLNSYTCLFSFDSAWDNLIKFAVFIRNEVYYNVSLPSDACTIPFEVLEKPGNVYIGVFGFDKAENSSLRISVTPKIMTVLKGSFSAESVTADEEELTIWEQYVAASQNARDKAYEYAQSAAVSETNAQTAAEEARNAAEEAKISLSEEEAARTAKDTELEERITSSETTLEGKADKDETFLLTKVSDSFIVSYDLNPGYYLLSGNTQITYHTQETQFNMDVLPPSIEIVDKYIPLEYKTTDSQLLVRIGKPTIDYDTLYFQMPIIFFGNMVNKNDETDCTPILYCCYSGATPGSLTGSIPTAYERTLTYDPVTKLSDIPTNISELTNDSNFATESYVDDSDSDTLAASATYTDNRYTELFNTLSDDIIIATDIAKGRATGYVFDTIDDMNTWLADDTNTAKLVLGDNLYIRATDVPDYWWDGNTAQQLETQKVDLSEYATIAKVEEEVTARTNKDTELEEKITELTEQVVINTTAVNNLDHNTQYRITIPLQDYGVYQLYFVFDGIGDIFECSAYIAPVPLAPVIFTKDTEVSGEDYPISWFGDDCDENGVFTPQANTHYEISFKRVGTDSDNKPIIIARVGAWQ